MGEIRQIRPLTATERQFAEDSHHMINKFLKLSRLDAEEFFDVVVFDFLLSVEIYLDNEALRNKYSFETVSYMYMRRAVYRHFRKRKAKKRNPVHGADISFDEVDAYAGNPAGTMEIMPSLEYCETIRRIEGSLTDEQKQIFLDKLRGYSLKEIAENSGIRLKRVYRQFGRIKSVVAGVMGNEQL